MNTNNPVILLSYINTLLRDKYSSFDDLCSDLDIEKEKVEKTLNDIGYYYNEKLNQFK